MSVILVILVSDRERDLIMASVRRSMLERDFRRLTVAELLERYQAEKLAYLLDKARDSQRAKAWPHWPATRA